MLTELQIRRAKPRERAYKLGDSGWLYLLVTPSGGKLWRQNYRYNGKIKTIALGRYPEITLTEARALAAVNRAKLAHGEDPAPGKQRRITITIGDLASEWFEARTPELAAPSRAALQSHLSLHLLPALGERDPRDITAADLEAAITAIAAKSPTAARRVLGICGDLFDTAIRRGIITGNPARALRGIIARPPTQHHAAITDPGPLGVFLRAVESGALSPMARLFIKFLILVFTRPTNVREAEWVEINQETATWTIPAAKTKTAEDYIVPLSRQALNILGELQPVTGHRHYIFSLARDMPLSRSASKKTIKTLGYEGKVTLHGFRATARTLLHERLGFPPDAIEAQLGHTVPDRLGRAYNRARHLDVRREMMQAWADFLDDLRKKAQ